MIAEGRIKTICSGGGDWWYHNRGHVDMQLICCFAKEIFMFYASSTVMQKPNFLQPHGTLDFLHLGRM
jgi:hypothetical protein